MIVLNGPVRAYLPSSFVVVKVHQAPGVTLYLARVQKPTREPSIKL